MDLHTEILQIGRQAQVASRDMAGLAARKKNAILMSMADALDGNRARIAEENARDMEAGRAAGRSRALLDRLLLNAARIDAMIAGLRDVAALKDPVGHVMSRWLRPNGLEIVKQRVSIGVIAVIYESRPNVTVDTAGLCLKTGNVIILRGGKEAFYSNAVLADLLVEGGRAKGLPEHAVQLIRTTDRDAVRELVQLEGLVDLAIPRGGESLIRAVTAHARVPVIKHYKGVCHVYVDESAQESAALAIVENAKCQRPGVCNALETVLVHADIAPRFLPVMAQRLSARGCSLCGDARARAIVASMDEATEGDWYAEYLDLRLAVRVVDGVQDAVAHINQYGSHHSDAIIADSEQVQKVFTQRVDSAVVYVNASTRFTDGGEFGMGAEIGISTDKLHARGPMGLDELTTYKYVVQGKGHIRE
ncbi:MAG: glutamate-5-semialdehyde dehydrogenase [Kiritimatiellia bacterium]